MLFPCNSVCNKCTAKFRKKGNYIFHNKCDRSKYSKKKQEVLLSRGRETGGYNTEWVDFVLSCFPKCLQCAKVKGFIKFYLNDRADKNFLQQIQSSYDQCQTAEKKNVVCLVL